MDNYPVDSIHIGAEEFVYTTHVTHQQLFYVHVESRSTILDDIMLKLETRYTHLKPEEKPLLNKRLGSLCAAKFTDDGVWYRAKITGLLKNGHIEVQFVDYGNTDYVTEERIKAIDPDIIKYPVQSYRCSLAGVSCSQGFWTPELIIQFEDRVVDRRCRAVFVGGNGDEMYEIQMFDSDGVHINPLFGAVSRGDKKAVQNGVCHGSGFQEVSFDPGAVFQAAVVYVNSPGLFWCQNTQFVNEILILSEELSRLHMIQEMKPLTDVRRGTVCAAKFSEDDAWYRGIVDSVSGRKAKVYFVDYGNTEVVSLDVICNLKSEMRTLPALGIKCRLGNVDNKGRDWRPEIIEAFEELVVDKEFEVKVIGKEGDVYIVTLFDVVDNKDVGAQLQSVMHRVNLDAINQDINCNKQIPSAAAAASGIGPSLNVGSKVDVYLSWVDNPGDFWVQLSSAEDLLEQLSQELQEVYSHQQPLAQPIPGAFVVAKYSHDRKWYRSLVLKVFEDQRVKVLFIDYGNTDIVFVTDLRQVTAAFGQVIPLASRCCLAGVQPAQKGGKSWADNAKTFLEEITENGCQCEILSETTSHKIVNLRVGNRDVAREMLTMGIVCESNAEPKSFTPLFFPEFSWKQSFTEQVIVTHVDSPTNFWCRATTSIPLLQDLMKQINQQYAYGNKIPLAEPVIGQACIVFSSRDKSWYRAKITDISSSSYGVHFLDYGNAEVVPKYNVFVPEPKFMSLTSQAFHCSISVSGDSSLLTDAFNKAVVNRELRLHVLEVSGDRAVVELFDGQTKVSELLKGNARASKESAKEVDFVPAKDILVGSTVKAFASYVVSPNKLFIHLTGVDEELEDLMDNLALMYSGEDAPPVVSQPRAGQPCVALYAGDGSWYRGQIQAVQGNACVVLFVDYGNEDTVNKENIRELLPELARVPVLAHRCSIHGVPQAGWSAEALQHFDALIMEKELTCTFVTSSSVRVVIDSQDVAAQLLQAGFVGTAGASASEHSMLHMNRDLETKPKTSDVIARSDKRLKYTDVRREESGFGDSRDRRASERSSGSDSRDEGVERRGFGGPVNGRENGVRRGRDSGFERDRNDVHSDDGRDSVARSGPYRRNVESGGFRETTGRHGRDSRFEDARRKDRRPIDDRESDSSSGSRTDKDSRFTGSRGREPGSGEGRGQRNSRFSGNRESTFSNSHSDKKMTFSQSLPGTNAEFVYPEIPCEPENTILVHMDDDGTFYLQLPSMEKDILFLSKRLAGSYKGGSGPRLREMPVVSTICCAKFADDGNMYRAKVEDVQGSRVVLRYVDYGNTGECSVNDLKFLFPDLLQYPVQAFPCKLRGYNWSLDDAEKFAKATLDKDLTVTFVSSTCPFEVDIMTPEGDLLQVLTGESVTPAQTLPKPSGMPPKSAGFGQTSQPGGFGTRPAKLESDSQTVTSNSPRKGDGTEVCDLPSEVLPKQIYPPQSPPQETCAAFISHIGKDGYFYLQLAKDLPILDSISAKLLALPENIKHSDVSQGASCAVVFSEDSAWYRARITETHSDSVSIFFVDYGNEDSVNTNSVKPLSRELLAYPPLAYKSQFREVGTLSPEAQCKLAEYLTEHQVVVTFSGQSAPFDVSVQTEAGQDLQEVICTLKKYRLPAVPSEVTPVGVTHIEDDGRFFIQLYQNYSAVKSLQNTLAMASDVEAVNIESVHVEMPCCLKLEDGLWHRGTFTEATDESVHVFLVDSGRTVITNVDSLRSLPAQFLKNPPFALECRLKGVEKWTESLRDKFSEMTQDKILNATFHSKTFPLRVSLARSIELDLLGLSAPAPDSPEKSAARKPSPPDVISQQQTAPQAAADCAESQAAYISHVDPHGGFYVQLVDREQDLNDLADSLDSLLADSDHLNEVAAGDVVCAKFTEDDAWYRARVESCTDDEQFLIRFIDYGNSDVVGADRLAALPDKVNISSVPAFAVKCRFFGLTSDLTTEQADKLRDIVADQTVAVVFRSLEDDVQEVDVSLDGVLVAQLLGLQTQIKLPDLKNIPQAADDENEHSEVVQDQDKSVEEPLGMSAREMSAVEEPLGMSANPGMMENRDSSSCLGLSSVGVTVDALAAGVTVDVVTAGVTVDAVNLDKDNFELASSNESTKPAETVLESASFCEPPNAASKISDSSTVVEAASRGDAARARVSADDRMQVTVSHVVSPDSFYMQLERDKFALDDMMNGMFEHFSNQPESSRSVEELHAGDVCAALFEDGSWYRVLVDTVTGDGTCEVLYMDYGNREVVDAASLRHLPERYKTSPPWAVEAKLGGVRPEDGWWTQEAVQEFKALVEDRHLLADVLQVSEDGAVCTVHLLYLGIPIHDELMKKGHAVAADCGPVSRNVRHFYSDGDSYGTGGRTDESAGCLESTHVEADSTAAGDEVAAYRVQTQRTLGCVSNSLQELTQTSVYVSHSVSTSPFQFWCQLTASSDTLSEISSTLARIYGSSSKENVPPEPLCVGDIVVAVFDDDGEFYRAQVLSVIGSEADVTKTIQVRFVDYGNESEVSQNLVFKLHEELYAWPAQAFCCCMDKVQPVDGSWCPEMSHKLSEIVAQQQLLVELVGREPDGVILVDAVLQETGQSLVSLVLEAGLATAAVLGTQLNLSSKSIETCRADDISEIETLEISQPILESTISQPILESTNSELILESTNSELILDSAISEPILKSSISEPILESTISEPTLESTMSQPVLESTMMVGNSQRDRLAAVTFEDADDNQFRSVKLSRHTEYDVTVSNDELPSSFHVQLLELRDQYLSLVGEIADHVSSSPADNAIFTPDAGVACLVQHCGLWYRGLVIAREPDSWNVKSVDCGWTVNVSAGQLMVLPAHLRELPVQSVPCYLVGIVPVELEWATDGVSFFMDSVRDTQLCMYVVECADDGKYGIYLNDLDNSDSQSVNRALVELGYAEVVPGSNIEFQLDMERTLDSNMLQDLEESFNEVSQLKCNADCDWDGEAMSSIAFDSENPLKDTYEDSDVCRTAKLEMDKGVYHLVPIPHSLMNTSQSNSCSEDKNYLPSTDDHVLYNNGCDSLKQDAMASQAVMFDCASAVERIDKMGCVDNYPDEGLFAEFESLEDAVCAEDRNVSSEENIHQSRSGVRAQAGADEQTSDFSKSEQSVAVISFQEGADPQTSCVVLSEAASAAPALDSSEHDDPEIDSQTESSQCQQPMTANSVDSQTESSKSDQPANLADSQKESSQCEQLTNSADSQKESFQREQQTNFVVSHTQSSQCEQPMDAKKVDSQTESSQCEQPMDAKTVDSQTESSQCEQPMNLVDSQTESSQCEQPTNLVGSQTESSQCEQPMNSKTVDSQTESSHCEQSMNLVDSQTESSQCEQPTNLVDSQTKSSQCEQPTNLVDSQIESSQCEQPTNLDSQTESSQCEQPTNLVNSQTESSQCEQPMVANTDADDDQPDTENRTSGEHRKWASEGSWGALDTHQLLAATDKVMAVSGAGEKCVSLDGSMEQCKRGQEETADKHTHELLTDQQGQCSSVDASGVDVCQRSSCVMLDLAAGASQLLSPGKVVPADVLASKHGCGTGKDAVSLGEAGFRSRLPPVESTSEEYESCHEEVLSQFPEDDETNYISSFTERSSQSCIELEERDGSNYDTSTLLFSDSYGDSSMDVSSLYGTSDTEASRNESHSIYLDSFCNLSKTSFSTQDSSSSSYTVSSGSSASTVVTSSGSLSDAASWVHDISSCSCGSSTQTGTDLSACGSGSSTSETPSDLQTEAGSFCQQQQLITSLFMSQAADLTDSTQVSEQLSLEMTEIPDTCHRTKIAASFEGGTLGVVLDTSAMVHGTGICNTDLGEQGFTETDVGIQETAHADINENVPGCSQNMTGTAVDMPGRLINTSLIVVGIPESVDMAGIDRTIDRNVTDVTKTLVKIPEPVVRIPKPCVNISSTISEIPCTAADIPRIDLDNSQLIHRTGTDNAGLFRIDKKSTAHGRDACIYNFSKTILDTVLDTPYMVLNTTETVVDTSEAVVDTTETVLDIPDTVVDTSKTVLDNLETVLDTPEIVLDTPETVLETEKIVLDTPETIIDIPSTVVDIPETVVDKLTTVVNIPGTVVHTLGTVVDKLTTVVDALKTVVDALKTVVETPETVVDIPETVVDTVGTVVDTLMTIIIMVRTVVDTSENVADTPDNVADTPDNVADTPENVADTAENVADTPENVADALETAVDSPETIIDVPETVHGVEMDIFSSVNTSTEAAHRFAKAAVAMPGIFVDIVEVGHGVETEKNSCPTDELPTEASCPTDELPTEASCPTDELPMEASCPTDELPTEASCPTDELPTEASCPTDELPTEAGCPTDELPIEASYTTDELLTDELPTEASCPTDELPTEAGCPTDELPTEAGCPTDELPLEASYTTDELLTDELPTEASCPTDELPTEASCPTDELPIEASYPTDELLTDELPTEASCPTDELPTEASCPTDELPTEASCPTDELPMEASCPTDELPTKASCPTDELPTEASCLTDELPTEASCPTDELPTEASCPTDELRTEELPTNELPAEASYPTDELLTEASYPTDELPIEASCPTDELTTEDSCPTDELPMEASCPTDELPTEASCPTDELPTEASCPTDELPMEASCPTDELRTEQLPTDELPAEASYPTDELPTEASYPTDELPTETSYPTDELPTEASYPTDELPTEASYPTDELPTEASYPTDELPTEASYPTDELPTEASYPTDELPTEASFPTDELPTEASYPTDELPREASYPTDELPTEASCPTDELPTEASCPTDELPTDELPTDELPTDELPTHELPTHELPTEASCQACVPCALDDRTLAEAARGDASAKPLLSADEDGGGVGSSSADLHKETQNTSSVMQDSIVGSTEVPYSPASSVVTCSGSLSDDPSWIHDISSRSSGSSTQTATDLSSFESEPEHSPPKTDGDNPMESGSFCGQAVRSLVPSLLPGLTDGSQAGDDLPSGVAIVGDSFQGSENDNAIACVKDITELADGTETGSAGSSELDATECSAEREIDNANIPGTVGNVVTNAHEEDADKSSCTHLARCDGGATPVLLSSDHHGSDGSGDHWENTGRHNIPADDILTGINVAVSSSCRYPSFIVPTGAESVCDNICNKITDQDNAGSLNGGEISADQKPESYCSWVATAVRGGGNKVVSADSIIGEVDVAGCSDGALNDAACGPELIGNVECGNSPVTRFTQGVAADGDAALNAAVKESELETWVHECPHVVKPTDEVDICEMGCYSEGQALHAADGEHQSPESPDDTPSVQSSKNVKDEELSVDASGDAGHCETVAVAQDKLDTPEA